MFASSIDLYEAPPPWWETDCVQFGMSYVPVKSRLTSLMGSHVVRLSDRKYMMQLALKLQEDDETQQKNRIEQRKLKTTLLVPQLRELLPKSLLKKMIRRRYQCYPKLSKEATKKCKQLPLLLLAEDES